MGCMRPCCWHEISHGDSETFTDIKKYKKRGLPVPLLREWQPKLPAPEMFYNLTPQNLDFVNPGGLFKKKNNEEGGYD